VFPFRKRRAHDHGWLAWPTASALGNRRALLLSPRQFEREVARERLRSSRRSIPFCVLTINLLAAGANLPGAENSLSATASKRLPRASSQLKKQSRKLVDILHHKLRMTDEKGVLSATCFGVLLVDTAEMGGRVVLDRLTELCLMAGLNVHVSLQVHDPEGFGSNDDESAGASGPRSHRRHDDHDASNSDHDTWVRKPSVMMDSATASGNGSVLATAPAATRFAIPGESAGASVEKPALGQVQAIASMPHSVASVEDRVSFAGEETFHQFPLASRVAKRALDVFGASVGLVLTGPFVLAAVAAIKWNDRGPAFFCQTREGQFGRPFTIYKLRTMIVDAEKSQAALRGASHRDGPAFKISRDPRVTKVGQFLRSTCLDELPQLINVLKGDMSLVGPRPLPWHESRACERWHRRRLDVRPGLTCIWQVNKGKAETFNDWMRMDLQYIDQLGFFKDLQLIAQTVIVPVTGRGSE
jgi:lipopolysaccharide/colanic/teichoic acid biosynthesis glycosyltransferase